MDWRKRFLFNLNYDSSDCKLILLNKLIGPDIFYDCLKKHNIEMCDFICDEFNFDINISHCHCLYNEQTYMWMKKKLNLIDEFFMYDFCRNGNIEMVQKLFKPEYSYSELMSDAVTSDNLELCKWIYDQYDYPNKNSLNLNMDIINLESLPLLKWLYKTFNIDVNSSDTDGYNVFHHACVCNNIEVLEWLLTLDIDKHYIEESIYYLYKHGNNKIIEQIHSKYSNLNLDYDNMFIVSIINDNTLLQNHIIDQQIVSVICDKAKPSTVLWLYNKYPNFMYYVSLTNVCAFNEVHLLTELFEKFGIPDYQYQMNKIVFSNRDPDIVINVLQWLKDNKYKVKIYKTPIQLCYHYEVIEWLIKNRQISMSILNKDFINNTFKHDEKFKNMVWIVKNKLRIVDSIKID